MCVGHLAHPRPFSREQWRGGEGDRENGEINGLTTFELDITGMDLATLQVLPQGVKAECELVDAGCCGSRIREDVPVRRKTDGDRV